MARSAALSLVLSTVSSHLRGALSLAKVGIDVQLLMRGILASRMLKSKFAGFPRTVAITTFVGVGCRR